MTSSWNEMPPCFFRMDFFYLPLKLILNFIWKSWGKSIKCTLFSMFSMIQFFNSNNGITNQEITKIVCILDPPEGNLLIKKSLFADAQVRFNFIKVMQNSSRFTKVSRLGNIELVTPTLFIWSSHADKHSYWSSPTLT